MRSSGWFLAAVLMGLLAASGLVHAEEDCTYRAPAIAFDGFCRVQPPVAAGAFTWCTAQVCARDDGPGCEPETYFLLSNASGPSTDVLTGIVPQQIAIPPGECRVAFVVAWSLDGAAEGQYRIGANATHEHGYGSDAELIGFTSPSMPYTIGAMCSAPERNRRTRRSGR